MDARTTRHLIYILTVALALNLIIAWIKGQLDFTAISVSLLGSIGYLHGSRRSDRDRRDRDDDDR